MSGAPSRPSGPVRPRGVRIVRRALPPPAAAGLLILFLLVGLTYACTSPFLAVSDERAHLARAAAAGNGDLLGRAPAPSRPTSTNPLRVRQDTYIATTTRSFRIPDRLSFHRGETDGCFILKPDHPAICPPPTRNGQAFVNSYVGVYPPLPYLLPGLASRIAPDKKVALTLGRLVNGLSCLALLAFGVLALHDRSAPGLSVLGLAVVLWPNLLVLAWGLNPNGVEITAAIAFVAGLLRLARDEAPPRWVWTGTAVSGFVLCSSRPLSPVFAAFALLLPLMLVGPRACIRRMRAAPRRAAVAGAAVVVAAVVTGLWDRSMHVHRLTDPDGLPTVVGDALHQLPHLVEQSVAALGWGEVGLPREVYLLWFAVLAALWLLALSLGDRRERIAAVAVPAAFVVLATAVFVVTHPSGFPVFGRYVQPALSAVPLLWVEIVRRHRDRLPAHAQRALVGVLALVVAGTQLDALYVDGRRWAVGVHGRAGYLFSGAVWSPVGGWLPWAGVALLGVAALVAGLLRRPDRSERPAPPAVEAEPTPA